MPRYLHLADRFALGRHCRIFGGPVVASDEVIYAIAEAIAESDGAKEMMNSQLRGPGRIMEMAAGLVEAALPIPDLDKFECSPGELAVQFADEADWPVPIEGSRAFVFTRVAISEMRLHAMGGGLGFAADLVDVTVYVASKRREAATDFLTANGFNLDTRTLWQRWFGRKAG